jgi:hypothetical protein
MARLIRSRLLKCADWLPQDLQPKPARACGSPMEGSHPGTAKWKTNFRYLKIIPASLPSTSDRMRQGQVPYWYWSFGSVLPASVSQCLGCGRRRIGASHSTPRLWACHLSLLLGPIATFASCNSSRQVNLNSTSGADCSRRRPPMLRLKRRRRLSHGHKQKAPVHGLTGVPKRKGNS